MNDLIPLYQTNVFYYLYDTYGAWTHFGASGGILVLFSAFLYREIRERGLMWPTIVQGIAALLCINHNLQLAKWGYLPIAHLVMGYEFAYLLLSMIMVKLLACERPWWLRLAAWLYLIVAATTALEYILVDQCYCNRDLSNKIYWWRITIGILIDWILAILLYSCRVDTSTGE